MPKPSFHFPIRIYWEDTDAGGVVYHSNYLCFLERARTEWLRSVGVVQSQLSEQHGLVFAIADLSIRFLRPARLDDELLATVELEALGRASMQFSQKLIRMRDDALIATAEVRAACLDKTSFKPRPIPSPIALELQKE